MKKIATLNNYIDWYEKARYDFCRYEETSGVYELADCLLTLNALPEWIAESKEAPQSLKTLALSKLQIMKGKQGFIFDETQLDDIDQKLRFIRLFCNHSKHGEPKEKFPKIEMSAHFDLSFPVKFEYITIGDRSILAREILTEVLEFWRNNIEKVPLVEQTQNQTQK